MNEPIKHLSLKTDHQKRVEKFMRLADQEIPWSPEIPSEEVRRLRAKLILEEALETVSALGFSVVSSGNLETTLDVDSIIFIKGDEPDIVQVADGCADISVVTIGTLSAFGIPDMALLEEVDASNLRKFGPGGYKRDDGKWMKPPDWEPPRIEELLTDLNDLMNKAKEIQYE